MSLWSDQMDRLLTIGNQTFGHDTTYQRPGFSAFAITGVPEFLDRLEDVNRGQFYSIFYRTADFANATFTSQVIATFTGVPNNGDTIIFDGVTYTAVLTVDNSTPNQFQRGSSALGSASNLAGCINADPALLASGFFSSSTVAHPTCTAQWVDNGNGTAKVIVSQRLAGSQGDLASATDHMYAVTIDSKFFYGGVPLNGDLVTIGGVLYAVSDVPEMDPEGGIQIRLEKKN